MLTSTIRYEYRSDELHRFWEPSVHGTSVVMRFGMIGEGGRTRTKAFSTVTKAHEGFRRRVCEKLAAGFKPTLGTSLELFQFPMSDADSLASCSCCIGQHVPDLVAQDMCDWMTACIRHGMAPEQFGGVLERLMNDADDELSDALGHTGADSWIERAHLSDLGGLYAAAVTGRCQKFIWFDKESHFEIVALRGNPGALAIEACVLGATNSSKAEWPLELKSGAPIASMTCHTATFRDGRVFRVEA